MATISDLIIDGIGGTTAVGRLMLLPPSTVHAWRRKGIPEARLDHLRLKVAEAKLVLAPEVEKLLHDACSSESLPIPSPGKTNPASQQVAA